MPEKPRSSEGPQIHPTAQVDARATIGRGTKIWHCAQIREGARIGEDCTIGKDVYIDRDVVIGSRVKIQNGVSVYRGVTIEDDVFVGPHAVFTNDKHPRAFNEDWQVTPTLVRRGASIGANATIVCGVVIGEFALVGAGAVVTTDVPPHALVVGVPARPTGRVDRLGRRIDDVPADAPLATMLIGYGSMGENHARALASLRQEFRLSVIADPDPARRAAAMERYPDARVIPDFAPALPEVTAVVIASPIETHADIAAECLRAGKHCLVEKPLAMRASEAHALAALAAEAGAILQTGHVERFNPAVEWLFEVLRGQRIVAISGERLGPNPGRAATVDVVLDLMVHDLEIADALIGGELISVQASGTGRSGTSDYASAILRYDGGELVTLTASRVTESRIRRLRVTTESACYDLDYMARTILVTSKTSTSYSYGDGRLAFVRTSVSELVTAGSAEPLIRQALDFCGAVRGRNKPRVDGAAGARATALAETVCAQIAAERSRQRQQAQE